MKDYKEIQGWFNFAPTYDFLLSTVPDNGTFVECGAWLGKSSAYLCDQAKDRIKIYVVDTWQGSFDEKDPTHTLAKQQDTYKLFLENMGNRLYTPIKKISKDASKDFDDLSCDVVFIDMTHTYEEVKNDISFWLPKVKQSGYIAGHDYQKAWPEVVDAVDEIFGKENILEQNTCWIYHKK